MGEILCSIGLGLCLILAGLFYRRFVKKEHEIVERLNRERTTT